MLHGFWKDLDTYRAMFMLIIWVGMSCRPVGIYSEDQHYYFHHSENLKSHILGLIVIKIKTYR